MFWFKQGAVLLWDAVTLFQYIICFGSRTILKNKLLVNQNFNTSYVLVQVNQMDDFPEAEQFQYIICFGSRNALQISLNNVS